MPGSDENEPDERASPTIEPMCRWERLVKELFELHEATGQETSERRNEIHGELQEMDRRYREEHPQFFQDHDDEFGH